MRLYGLMVKASLLCLAGAASVAGQSAVPKAGVALAFEAGDNGAKGKAAEGGSVLPVVPTNAGYAGNTECKTCHPSGWACTRSTGTPPDGSWII
jgi:hypothetical protein